MKGIRFPDGPFTLNRSSPQANGLVFWATPVRGGRVREHLRGVSSTYPGTRATNAAGRCPSDYSFATGDCPQVELTNNFSVSAWFQSPSSITGAGNCYIATNFRYTSESIQTGWGLVIIDGGGSPGYCFILGNNNASNNAQTANFSTLAAGLRHIVGTTDGATKRLYIDGVQVASSTAANLTAAANSPGYGLVNTLSDGTSLPIPVYETRVYNRVLTPTEIAEMWLPDTRLDLYQQRTGRVWSFGRPASGGGGRTTKNTRAFPLGMEIGMGWGNCNI